MEKAERKNQELGDRKSRDMRLLLNFATLIVTLLVCLFLAEVGFRLFWHNPYAGEETQHVLPLRRHHPKMDLITDRSAISKNPPVVRFRTDERSYIIPSRRFGTPDKTIVFFGGSTVECLGVQENLRFHHLVSINLEQRGLKVNALNIGHYGNTVHDALNLLLNHVVLDEPDVAILMHTTNDIGVLRFDLSYNTRMGFFVRFRNLRRWYLDFLASHSSLVGFYLYWRDHGMKITTFDLAQDRWHESRLNQWTESARFQAMNEVRKNQYRRRLESFIDLCRNFNIIPVLMTEPRVSFAAETTPPWAKASEQSEFNQIVRDVCFMKHAILIDLEEYIEKDIEKYSVPKEYFLDEIHVADKGSEVYAGQIAEALWREIFSKEPKAGNETHLSPDANLQTKSPR